MFSLQLDRMAVDCGIELKSHNVACISLWPGAVKTETIAEQLETSRTRTDKKSKVKRKPGGNLNKWLLCSVTEVLQSTFLRVRSLIIICATVVLQHFRVFLHRKCSRQTSRFYAVHS